MRVLAAVATATALATLTAVLTAPPSAASTSSSTTASSLTAALDEIRDDYCLGQCSDVLPPGQNGNATLVEVLGNQAFGTLPAHSADQLGKYAGLINAYSGLTDDQIENFFNDASFGVPAGQVESTLSPRSDVTITRDKATGVPHIKGTTRDGAMFGAGFAGAQDRLFLMDLMRHVGRGDLTTFAGGAQGNRELEQSVWRNSPYTEADFRAQLDRLRASGPRGAQLYADVENYVAGANAYIDRCMSRRDCPGEYVLAGHLDSVTNAGGPKHFTITDLIAISGVIGGLFGGGGGMEMQSALVRVAARAKYGTAAGDQAWQAFRGRNDPETVLTLHDGQSFPWGDPPAGATGVALPDLATTRPVSVVEGATGSAVIPETEAEGILPGLRVEPGQASMSNAVVISGAKSATGHPIGVFGPQTGYFAPQLLMLQEIEAPGIKARGAAFAGLNMYVLLGRGPDYAWSATSSNQDITDTYALTLCEPAGGTPTQNSAHYMFRGQCVAMEKLERANSWKPTTADNTPAGSYKLVIHRTKYGLVTWRGTVNGTPTAFAVLRSTYMREVDSAIGFMMFNEPGQMGTAADFMNSAANISFNFNWFYVNSADAAYFLSGDVPTRSAVSDPDLPMAADPAHEWQGWDPATNVATYLPVAQRPKSVNQDYYVSWNNKQARDFGAADGNFSFSAVHRGDLLDKPVKAALGGGGKLDRAGTVKIVAEAAVTDLRGKEVLPELLRVLGTVNDPALSSAIAKLSAWRQAGSLRKETAAGSKAYAHADAIRVMDAWWPKLVRAQFRPGLGGELYQALVNALQINESPSGHQRGDVSSYPSSANGAQPHKGSALQYGWWGWVDKDLRAVLGDPVAGALPRRHCGDGTVAGCRQVLLASLTEALAEPAATTYPGDDVCSAGDQWCADTIRQAPLGGIKHALISWQNRPTYHQVVSFPARRGDDVANLARGRTVTVSSAEGSLPGARAVDGDLGTRWGSAHSDNQWIRVDLGSVRRVGRVILRWEAAYGKSYRIEVSKDGGSWSTVHTTTAGDGGVDNVTFPAVDARHVRMSGVQRGTQWGYSLWELGAYSR